MSPAATQIQRQSRQTMLQVQAGLARARDDNSHFTVRRLPQGKN